MIKVGKLDQENSLQGKKIIKNSDIIKTISYNNYNESKKIIKTRQAGVIGSMTSYVTDAFNITMYEPNNT